MNKHIVILLAALAFTSCNSFLETESKEELVVEGWIENGHAPVVMVSSTLPVSATERSIDDIQEHILRYATVSIEHDGQKEYLTARLTDKHKIGNYFTSSTLRGEIGHSYRLNVEWLDYKAEASCTIPEPTPIDTSYFEKEKDNLSYVFKIKFKNNPAEGKYYHSFRRNGIADTSSFISVPFSTLNGKVTKEEVTQSFMKYMISKDSYFHEGDLVAIKLATIEESMYEFWTRYTNVSSTTGSTAISSATNLKGNVKGAIGYWAGYGISVTEQECIGKK